MKLKKLITSLFAVLWMAFFSLSTHLAMAHDKKFPVTVNEKLTTHQIYLVRHAEKQDDGTRDPALTKEGLQRAENLVLLLKDKNISQVYSTDYKRTQQTAKPMASHLKTKIKIYDPRKLKDFSEQILQLRHNVLIVGHSNTTPALATMLGGESMGEMAESEYGRIYQLKFVGDKVITHLINSSNH